MAAGAGVGAPYGSAVGIAGVGAGIAGGAQLDGHFDALRGQLLILCHLDHNGALHPLAEQLTAVLVHAGNAAGCVVGVGCTAAGAVELCPAVLALLAGVGVAVLELVPVRSHIPQAMQLVVQSLLATAPLSWLEHITTGLRGPPASIMMTFLGQMLAQAPQPVHLSLSTLATPSTMWMASNLQTLVQSPRPMQAKEQVLGPPYRVAAAAQVWMPL